MIVRCEGGVGFIGEEGVEETSGGGGSEMIHFS